MANTQFLAVDKLDFYQIKENLKTYLQSQSTFQDYNFEGSNISKLLDIMAYNTYMLSFYLNMAGNESFLDSALIRDSVASKAAELNYIPRSYTSSQAEVILNINVTNNDVQSVTVPKGFQFTGTKDSKNYIFTTAQSQVVRRNTNSQFISNTISIYEGFPLTEYFVVNTAISEQTFVISNARVDLDSLEINVRTSNVNMTNTDYTYSESLYGIEATSTAYWLQPTIKNKYEIVFGDGVFGLALTNGNVIRADYRVASGNVADGISSFSASNTINSYSVSSTTVSA
jgi:hypothetical protein